MYTRIIWDCTEALAAALDGDREAAEQMVDQLEVELKQQNKRRRDELRRMMIVIVASLSRLEVRLMESDGPIHLMH